MPLTPESRLYEQKLERSRKKYRDRNAFASNRARKAQEVAAKKKETSIISPESVSAALVNSIANSIASRGPGKDVSNWLNKKDSNEGLLSPFASLVRGAGNFLLPSVSPPVNNAFSSENVRQSEQQANRLIGELPIPVFSAVAAAKNAEDTKASNVEKGITFGAVPFEAVNIPITPFARFGIRALKGAGAARSRLAAHQISMIEDNKQNPLDRLLEGLGPSERETLPWESAGELPKTDVVRTTRTTSISRPPKDRVDTIINSDTPITNTDFQAASLGIFKDDLEELAANGVEDSIIRKAIDQINDRTISGSKQPAKIIKENTEGYKVVWDPPAGDSTNLANVLRKRFIRLDKDGKNRFIEGRIKDGYTKAQAEKAWKGLGKVSDEELVSWWTNYRKHNPDVPWEIRAIKSDKAEDLWPVVGGIDFDHVYAAASAKGSGKFSNFTPLGHYLNRLKGKMSGPEFLDYLENPDNNLNYVFELLGGRNGAYAQSIAKAK